MGENRESHAWEIGPGWDVYYAGAITVLVAVTVMTSEPGPRMWAAIALLVALFPLYLFVGRRLNRDEEFATPKTLAFVLVVSLICASVILLDRDLGFLILVVAPLCFMTGGSAYGASALAIMLIGPGVVLVFAGEAGALEVLPGIFGSVLIVGFAYWFGRWCESVIEQSWERAALIEQLRESRAEATRLSEQAGALAEREHLAREMHDTLAQGFTSIVTLTQAVESELDTDPAAARHHLALMRETATDNLAETRAMVAARGPVLLEGSDLEAALERLADRLGSELGVSVEAEVVGAARPLPRDVQVCLLRTAQEALANVRKHAGADAARLRLAHTDAGVSLSVSDDGRGFDPDRDGPGNGLANMRRRARDLGGELDVETAPGLGTTVRLFLTAEETGGDAAPTEGAPGPASAQGPRPVASVPGPASEQDSGSTASASAAEDTQGTATGPRHETETA